MYDCNTDYKPQWSHSCSKIIISARDYTFKMYHTDSEFWKAYGKNSFLCIRFIRIIASTNYNIDSLHPSLRPPSPPFFGKKKKDVKDKRLKIDLVLNLHKMFK